LLPFDLKNIFSVIEIVSTFKDGLILNIHMKPRLNGMSETVSVSTISDFTLCK